MLQLTTFPFEGIKKQLYNSSIEISFINMVKRLNPLKFVAAQAQEYAQLEGLQYYLSFHCFLYIAVVVLEDVGQAHSVFEYSSLALK
jgi:hypothetical protein